MYKFITPLPSGGLPITNEDFLMIQNEAHIAINAICDSIDWAGFVVSGCIATQNGSNVTITSGFVYLDSQMMWFNGYTGVFPVYIKTGTPTFFQRVFKDGITKNVTIDTQAVATTSVPASGNYITFNPQPNRTLKSVITKPVDDKINQEITDRTNGDNTLNTRITNEVNTLNTAVNNKVNKAQEGWSTPNITRGGYTPNWSGDSVGYFKDSMGFVHLKGSITAQNVTGEVFTLPVGYRPSNTQYFGNKSVGTTDLFIAVQSNGVVNLTATGDGTFCMNGIYFYVG
jgi:hypothetical protein